MMKRKAPQIITGDNPAKRACFHDVNNPWELPSEDSARIIRIQQHAERKAQLYLDLCGGTGMLERLSQISEELRTGIAYIEGWLDDPCMESGQRALLDYVSHKVNLLKTYAKCALDQFEASKERLPVSLACQLEPQVNSLGQLGPAPLSADNKEEEKFGPTMTFCDDIVDDWEKALHEERGDADYEGFVRDILDRFINAQQIVWEVFAVCSTHVGHLLMADFCE